MGGLDACWQSHCLCGTIDGLMCDQFVEVFHGPISTLLIDYHHVLSKECYRRLLIDSS